MKNISVTATLKSLKQSLLATRQKLCTMLLKQGYKCEDDIIAYLYSALGNYLKDLDWLAYLESYKCIMDKSDVDFNSRRTFSLLYLKAYEYNQINKMSKLLSDEIKIQKSD